MWSRIFPERAVPDLVGLVGQLPNAVYIMSPGQPGCDIDVKNANRGPYPVGDTTAPDDRREGAIRPPGPTPTPPYTGLGSCWGSSDKGERGMSWEGMWSAGWAS